MYIYIYIYINRLKHYDHLCDSSYFTENTLHLYRLIMLKGKGEGGGEIAAFSANGVV